MKKRRPRMLDLFSGAGGSAVGYHRAGFDVVGVDRAPQPRYPFEFVRFDALQYLHLLLCGSLTNRFDAIHASPPCQHFSLATFCRPDLNRRHEDLLTPTVALLKNVGLPWVVENVTRAPLALECGIELCGLMFGLKVFRHRLFASSEPLWAPEHPTHRGKRIGVGGMVCLAGHGDASQHRRRKIPPDHRNKASWARGVGIDWMTRDELAQAIPPAYTEWVGKQLLPVVLESMRGGSGDGATQEPTTN